MEIGTLEEVKLIVDQIASNKIPPPNKAQSLVIIRQMVRMAEQIEVLKAQLASEKEAHADFWNEHLRQAAEMEVRLAECEKDAEWWKDELFSVLVQDMTRPSALKRIEEINAAIAAQKEES